MAEEAARSRLGRGLAALIGDVGEETAAIERARGQRRMPVEFLRPNPRNPRQSYSEVELDELAASIRERGIIQPIVVRTLRGSADHYEIIAGERRWRAAQRADMHARRGDGLSGARRIRAQPGRYSAADRQEPQPCRQYAPAAQTAGIGKDLSAGRQDFRGPRPRALGPAGPRENGPRHRRAGPQRARRRGDCPGTCGQRSEDCQAPAEGRKGRQYAGAGETLV